MTVFNFLQGFAKVLEAKTAAATLRVLLRALDEAGAGTVVATSPKELANVELQRRTFDAIAGSFGNVDAAVRQRGQRQPGVGRLRRRSAEIFVRQPEDRPARLQVLGGCRS